MSAGGRIASGYTSGFDYLREGYLAGVVRFFYRARLTITPLRVVSAMALSSVMLSLPCAPHFATFPIAYAIGDPQQNHFVASDDYSSRIDLYAFPVEQTIAYLFRGQGGRYFNIGLALPVTVLLGIFSCHPVGSIALRFQEQISGEMRKENVPLPARLSRAHMGVAGYGH
ncbi:hypothetical protein MRS76_13585 [Rhizobiaceae bacterium n13]|uniref:Uncharacterized protein n=1 Tax=Ferirhizobium litorale TaxID=2927786 RepID=A0AAE3QJ58_9HYPH|nr:hypothetical protein [Fererhizobium litorale]MDI7862990.1 hypothetical protein [Fererhizobium litorale]MDI7924063.1 hypothetical protein [Fererhizobium litorale]